MPRRLGVKHNFTPEEIRQIKQSEAEFAAGNYKSTHDTKILFADLDS